jgi:serine protease Do
LCAVPVSKVLTRKSKQNPRFWLPAARPGSQRWRPFACPPELASTGTGFYISSDGYIVTAGHVVKDCTEMRSANVSLKVAAADYQSDLAVLQASAKPAAFLKLRGNKGPRQGEAVVAISFPLAGLLVGEDGTLVGVLQSGLDDAKIVQLLGQVPQNVNFAVSTSTLQSFLNANQVPYVLAEGRGAKKTTAGIAAEATHYTILLEC